MIIDMTGHTTIIGDTQSGKTELANHLFQQTGGLYIDIEDKGQIQVDKTISSKNSVTVIRKTIKENRRVAYIPTTNKKLRTREIEALWIILKGLGINIYVYIDEAQHWGTARTNDFDIFAIRGLKHGIHIVVMTQRPAKISKTIASQSKSLVCFDISGYETKYFKAYNLPFAEIEKKLINRPDYYFVVFVRKKGVSRPYKLTVKK